MKILELTNYSAGACGVWQRAKQESIELSKLGHEVKIFTSNLTKGSEEIVPPKDSIGKIQIQRFPGKKLGGESFISWNFEQAFLDFSPDLVIAHSYRHLHTTKAIKLAKKINAKIFLVTHAPFIEGNATRSFFQKLVVNFYDFFIGPKVLKKFDKIITIARWEEPYLKKLGVKREKILYIPNGIPDEFFKNKVKPLKGKTVLFLGRIHPIKNLELLIKAFSKAKLKFSQSKLLLVGPEEAEYKQQLQLLIGKDPSIKFLGPIYNLKKKINKLQEADIFVLPSKREAMPQALLEAMALGKIVIASKTQGAKEIITNQQNGFLFEINNEKELVEKLSYCLDKKHLKSLKPIHIQARKTAEDFKWGKLIKKLQDEIQKFQ